jgi:hypothetical protein
MTNRILITLLLSMGMVLPTFAQQSSNQNASASQSVSAGSDDHLQSPRPPDFWDGDEPSLTWLILHPFASKQYVRRHVQPIQDRVNELDQITADNTRMIRDVDTRAQKGIQMVSDKTSLADEHAQDAAVQVRRPDRDSFPSRPDRAEQTSQGRARRSSRST